jgi:hypothetical protein
MIIKRKLKTLKRCNSTNEEDDIVRKKRKVNLNGGGSGGDYYYPLNLLGEIGAGIVPGKNGFSVSLCKQVSCSPKVEVVEEEEEEEEIKSTRLVSRPPLVKTSRGRVQVLPSRFNDSVIENWRKDNKSSGEEREEEIEEEACRKEKVKVSSNHSLKIKQQETKFTPRNYKYSSSSALCGEIDDEDKCEEIVRYGNSFEMKKQRYVDDEPRPKKEGVYGPEDFYSGDLVWGKSGRNEPFWPAIVIDPMTQAPELVLRSCIPDAACVMFFGHSGTENERDYAWVRRGMIFPFVDYVERLQEQSELRGCNPRDFQMALEEALLADQGFTEKLMQDIHMAAGNQTFDDSVYRWVEEAAGSSQYLDHVAPSQASFSLLGVSFSSMCTVYSFIIIESKFIYFQDMKKYRNPRACVGCGMVLSFKMAQKMKALIPGDQLLCQPCSKLTKPKHVCGICKRIWNHLDSQSWVRCDGCKVWIHSACDQISHKHFKDLGETDYYCPTCRTKFDFELSDSEKPDSKSKLGKNNAPMVLPDKVIVVCSGVEGIYFPSLHL